MFQKLLVEKTENTLIQLFRYSLVGGIAFLTDFGTLIVCTEYLKVYYLLSAMIAFTMGLIVNYLLSIVWVFRRNRSHPGVEFMVFALIGVVGLGFNEAIIWFFTDRVRLHYLVSKIIATVLVYLWNFFARKQILFNHPTISN